MEWELSGGEGVVGRQRGEDAFPMPLWPALTASVSVQRREPPEDPEALFRATWLKHTTLEMPDNSNYLGSWWVLIGEAGVGKKGKGQAGTGREAQVGETGGQRLSKRCPCAIVSLPLSFNLALTHSLPLSLYFTQGTISSWATTPATFPTASVR